MRFGLERMRALLSALGDPHRGRRSIHVVGSNGKSSTTRYCAALLQTEGHRVGAYFSPHLGGWHERVELDGAPVAPESFARAILRVADAAETLDLDEGDAVTQFEGVTAAAFLLLAEAGCEWQVVEAGLGGRWDATNVLGAPDAVAVTSISLEHTGLLGATHLEIAREKLAVAPEGSSAVVIGPLEDAALVGVKAAVRERALTPRWVEGDEVPLPQTAGHFQRANAATARAAVERALGRPLHDDVLAALATVEIPGRLERVPGRPALLIDGAHNPSGAEALARELGSALPAPRAAVVALLDDKDAEGVLAPLVPLCTAFYPTASAHPRSRDPG